MGRLTGWLLGLLLGLMQFSAPSWSADTARYSFTLQGVRGATLPPPGVYFQSDTAWYHADDTVDEDGDPIDLDFKMDMVCSINRVIYTSDFPAKTLGGAHFGAYLAVPTCYNHVKMGKLGVDDERTRVGDLDFCPLILEWHKPRFDIGFSYEVFIPTGDFDRDEPATFGKEYWTHMISAGGTGYLDKERTWTFSMIGRYEINHERKNMDYTPGDQFHIEWGAAKFIPKWKLDVGISGFAGWQITDDTGPGVGWDRDVHDRVFAVGPEIKYHPKLGDLCLSVRYHREFGARDHTEGHVTTFTLTKKF